MSTHISLDHPVETEVVDYDSSDFNEAEEQDPFVLFRMLLNGHEALEEFEDITDEMFRIKKQFEAISTMLTIIDAARLVRVDAVRPVFAPVWLVIYKSYLDLVSQLRESATADMGIINRYVEVVIPIMKDMEVPYTDKQLELQSFIDNLEKTEKNAQSFGTQFTTMQASLVDFSSKLSDFSTSVGDDMASAMRKALEEINELEKKLKDLKDKSKDFFPDIRPMEVVGTLAGSTYAGYYATALIASGSLKGTVLAGAASCLAGVSLVAPATILAILGLTGYNVYKIIQATTAYGEMTATAALLTAKRAKLAALAAEAAQAKALDLSVTMTIGNIKELIPRLGRFTDVLSIIKTDAYDLRKFIETLKNDPVKLNEVLNSQLDLISAVYSLLGTMLGILSSKVMVRPKTGKEIHGGKGPRKKNPGSEGSEEEDPPMSEGEEEEDPGEEGGPPKQPPKESYTRRVQRIFEALIQILRSINRFTGTVRDANEDMNIVPDQYVQGWLREVNRVLARIGRRARGGQTLTNAHIIEFIQAFNHLNTAQIQAWLTNTDWRMRLRYRNILSACEVLLDQLRRLRPHGPFRYRVPEDIQM